MLSITAVNIMPLQRMVNDVNVSAVTSKRPFQFTSSLGLALEMKIQERILVSSAIKAISHLIYLFSLSCLKFVTVPITDEQACFNSVALKA